MKYIAKVDFIDALDKDKQYRAGDEFICSDIARIVALCTHGIIEKVGE